MQFAPLIVQKKREHLPSIHVFSTHFRRQDIGSLMAKRHWLEIKKSHPLHTSNIFIFQNGMVGSTRSIQTGMDHGGGQIFGR